MQAGSFGAVVQRRVQQGLVQYKVVWSETDNLWIDATELPAAFASAGDSLHPAGSAGRATHLPAPSTCRGINTDTAGIAPEEVAPMCNTQKDFQPKRRRAAGWFFVARACQISVFISPLFLSESLPSVYFALAEMVAAILAWEGRDLDAMTDEDVRSFIDRWLPLLVYDNGCSLYRYMRHARRCGKTSMARLLALVQICVDAFHFRGHKGCKALGSYPLPAVWPESHKAKLANVDQEACEHIFAYLRRHVLTARCFGPMRHRWFMYLIIHARNLVISGAQRDPAAGGSALFLWNLSPQRRLHRIAELNSDAEPVRLRCGSTHMPLNYEVRTTLPHTRHSLCKWCFSATLRR